LKPLFRLVGRSEILVTKPAMDRARWKCEQCPSADNLRVVEFVRARLVRVLCARCRLTVGWPRATVG
jgi:hypothetical protein